MGEDKLVFIEGDHAFIENGWYFIDETDNLQGPYDSKEDAAHALTLYAKSL